MKKKKVQANSQKYKISLEIIILENGLCANKKYEYSESVRQDAL